MLHSLLPRAHAKTLALPLLGSIANGFDDWLAANGYTRGSRKNTIRMLPHVDKDLRKWRVHSVSELNHATLHASWRHLIKRFPKGAGTVRSLERYLTAASKLAADIKKAGALSAARRCAMNTRTTCARFVASLLTV